MANRPVAHLTSVHSRTDTRIFVKECRSLAAAGYDVSLVVADGIGNAREDGVRIVDAGCPNNRLRRMLVSPRRVLKLGLALDAEIYHLHDPELLMIAVDLLRAGKLVVFDAHEDVPVQILGKPYLNPLIRRLSSRLFSAYQSRVCRKLSGIVAATPLIRDKLHRVNANTITVSNYPIPAELASSDSPPPDKKAQVCYVGGIGRSRGIDEMVEAMDIAESEVRLALCGRFEEERLRNELVSVNGWKYVDDLGWLDRGGVRKVLNESVCGLVTLHPLPNYVDALPIKMFEYMSAGIPVIVSGFPLWRRIVEGADCGLCVDPRSPKEIAEAIDFLVRQPEEAKRMGDNGRQAVMNTYNWPNEERKLLEFYESLFARGGV